LVARNPTQQQQQQQQQQHRQLQQHEKTLSFNQRVFLVVVVDVDDVAVVVLKPEQSGDIYTKQCSYL